MGLTQNQKVSLINAFKGDFVLYSLTFKCFTTTNSKRIINEKEICSVFFGCCLLECDSNAIERRTTNAL